eukprot:Skav216764  [mRNA]  locus=scaffold3378:5808:6278:- [translate_table: standard]
MAFSFGKVLPRTFTLCSVARYVGTSGVGEPRGRILQSAESNLLHGHWSDRIGVAYYNGWATVESPKPHSTLEWQVICGTNGAQRVYIGTFDGAQNVATGTGATLATDETLVINTGAISSETSAFAVMEVITWNRALSDDEMVSLVSTWISSPTLSR